MKLFERPPRRSRRRLFGGRLFGRLLESVTRTGRVRVFVVEDEPTVSEVLRIVLERAGHEVKTTASCAFARSVLARHDPDILLLDLNLPDGSGLDLLRELRQERGKSYPIIVLSGFNQERTVVRAFALGADDYMTKPFAPRELLARMDRRLGA